MLEINQLLAPSVIHALKKEIFDVEGAEIFAILTKAPSEKVYANLKVICRGTRTEVPALLSRTESGDMTLHNHPSGVLQPSQADLNVATLFGEQGVGSMIINNEVSQYRIIVEPWEEKKNKPVDGQEVRQIFEETGILSKRLPSYEAREGQLNMALAVCHALNEDQALAIEAGTGTGKSLAYLVPALLWTQRNKGRIVIATKTIALQEQLIHKDIPLARSLIKDAPRACLVKGRNNFVCKRKMQDLKSNQLELFEAEEDSLRKEIEGLIDWVRDSGSGDRADLPFMPSYEAWEMVRSDADMCLGGKCPFFREAPFYESRRQAAQAKIMVVNQALLFADLALREESGNYQTAAVIPPYEHVILDEAHSMEDIATSHFGQNVASQSVRLLLGKLLSQTGGNKGVLTRLYMLVVEHSTKDDKALQLLSTFDAEVGVKFRNLQTQVEGQLGALSAALHEALNPDRLKNISVWIHADLLESGRMESAKEEAKELLILFHDMVLVLRKIRKESGEQSESFLEKAQGMLIELDARISRLNMSMTALKNFAIRMDDDKVPWLELKTSRNRDEFEYKVSPLDVSPRLIKALFKPFKAVIMTSATLDLQDKFKFFTSRNGLSKLEAKPFSCQTVPSPFDYQKQAQLILLNMPSTPNQRIFADDLSDLILNTVSSGHLGGTLVLFTSYKLLNDTAKKVEYPLSQRGIDLLVQGRSPRRYLIEHMKRTQGVLLGTDSFWEGVDLPGSALTKVIVTKLPFRQVSDPLFEARGKAIEKEGGSSFSDYSMPLALLKFKQGVGRLIRTKQDAGMLIIADNRISTKGYGRKFLSLVEYFPVWRMSLDELIKQLQSQGVVT